jgi:hypothetical protein
VGSTAAQARICDNSSICIQTLSQINSTYALPGKIPLQKLKQKYVLWTMAWVSENYSHATGRPHSPYMLDNLKFTELAIVHLAYH